MPHVPVDGRAFRLDLDDRDGALLIAILAGVAWLLYRVARRQGWTGGGRRREGPEEVLRARYARGEIDRATYARMLDDLRRGRVA